MNLKSLIIDLGADKTASELVALLNAKNIKQKTIGRCSVAGMGEVSPELTAKFLATMKGTIAALSLGNQTQQAQGILFEAFLDRFINNSDGLDFENEVLRGNLTAIVTQAGWSQTEIDALLAIGYVSVSLAGTDISEPEVQTVLDSIAFDATKTELMQSGATRWNAFVAALDAWDGTGEGPVL